MFAPVDGIYLGLGYNFDSYFKINDTKLSLDPADTILTSHYAYNTYYGLSKRNPTHLLALWFMGNFAQEGTLPYMILPSTAYDQTGRSARGYTQGRFRGNNLVYGELEYRFPLSKCGGLLGGVLFANATTTNNPFSSLELFSRSL